MSNIKLLLKVFTSPKRLRSLLSFNDKGYLHEIGWFKSFDSQSPVDQYDNPIPWVTYSFIDFIKPRLNKQHTVFEFGSGNSTYFYARHAGIVVSVEHDKEWFEKILATKPENNELIYCELVRDGDYCRVPIKLEETFDIIIVDGRDRVNCCKQAVRALSPTGVIVLDDSEREIYKEGIAFLMKNGFKELPFSGISPGLFYRKSTSVFYRPDNCLGV
ncbi:MAG: class I SAM-dependent methyltransferase [Bacteroidota bacterium]|nr:class I SAM-dependent methyltransferase [Bacteroidota bacterium]